MAKGRAETWPTLPWSRRVASVALARAQWQILRPICPHYIWGAADEFGNDAAAKPTSGSRLLGGASREAAAIHL